jgi:malonate-semialdehyde dehydrogenase (acetylating)/methylmalonate-semialdehyde dehydrogenase
VSELQVLHHWIDGRQRRDGQGFCDVFDPTRGSVSARLPLADAALVDEAVSSAARAQREWASQSNPPNLSEAR